MKETRAYNRLKKLFPEAHWVRIESWAAVGTFDSNGCLDKQEVWVECKQVDGPRKRDNVVVCNNVRPAQIAWEAARRASGGKTFVAIMIGQEMLLLPGSCIKNLKYGIDYNLLKNLAIKPQNLFR